MSLRPGHVNFDNIWNPLKIVVLRIVKCDPVSRNVWNSSFSDVYSLCVARPDSLAERLYKETCQLLESRVDEIRVSLSNDNSDQLLPHYTKEWQNFKQGVSYLHNLYSYLNTQYVKVRRPRDADLCYGNVELTKLDHHMEIDELGMDCWRKLITSLEESLVRCLMREIKKDREGRDGQQRYLSPVIESFLEVEKKLHVKNRRLSPPLYTNIFQEPLLTETKEYYQLWSVSSLSTMTCSDYMTSALLLREREWERAEKYFPFSKSEVSKHFQTIIVINQLDFFNQHVMDIVRQENKKDLRNMFLLLSPNNLCDKMQKYYSANVKEAVTLAIEGIAPGPNAHVQFVEQLITIRDRVFDFILEVFNNENAFRSNVDQAFTQAINERSDRSDRPAQSSFARMSRPAEMLCKYTDSLLKKGPKSLSESEVEDKLNNVIVLFKYINDRDVFQRFYQRMMCKRLIASLSISMDIEESMINKMKAVCGYDFTKKFHRMFNDIQLASELNKEFQKYLTNESVSLPYGFNILVLTHCSWPISPCISDFTLPHELHTCLSYFEKFYNSTYQGRKLRWVHNQSTLEIRLNYTDKQYLVSMNSLQAAVLLHLDALNKDVFSDREIEQGTQLKDQDLTRVLQSLVDAKFIVNKADGEYSLTRSYTNKRLKFKINLGQPKDQSMGDTEQVERQVVDDRRFFIQAAIVRIMKSRRQIKHNILVKEVLEQSKSRFQPPIMMIKRCIESLIEKGYMERTPTVNDEYSYLV